MWSCEQKPVILRPHHGMCLAYFEGKGYSGDFTRNMGEKLEVLLTNPRIHLQIQGDAICVSCPNRTGVACQTEDKVRGYDQRVLQLCGLQENAELSFWEFAGLVEKQILRKKKREWICGDCEWNDLCSTKQSRWAEELYHYMEKKTDASKESL